MRVEFDPELRSIYDTEGEKIADYDVWAGLNVLVPGQKFKVGLGPRLPEGSNRYDVTVRYRSPDVPETLEEIVIPQILDLDVWALAFVDRDEPDDRNIVRVLRDIADRIGPKRMFP